MQYEMQSYTTCYMYSAGYGKKNLKHVPQLSAGVLTSGIKVCKQICNMVSKN